MVGLSAFPSSLARLVLCGGGGLAPAWGPLVHQWVVIPWNPLQRTADVDVQSDATIPEVRCWSLPLDASSPWPTRLATVAAWMLSPTLPVRVARLRAPDKHYEHYQLWASYLSDSTVWRYEWHLSGKGDAAILRGTSKDRRSSLDLPTLPQWHALHPAHAALLLALYDVPEIRERVEEATSTQK